jgi:asparagine synthase (glutamine-hydrolysing)
MCGIAGIVSTEPSVTADLVAGMRDQLTHRGPDDEGLWVSPGRHVGLGHRRLSIIDLSPAGHQPMANEDQSVWIVFNGEIYNFQQLRQELIGRGHLFKSTSDTEVIIHGYEEWGVRCIDRLRGMFAFALWDDRRRTLLLARDRFGIKPLFYRELDGRLAFGSELKSLTALPGPSLAIDDSAIYDFLTYRYVPAPKTIYRDIRKLEAGHYATFRDGALSIHQYWDVPIVASTKIGEADAVRLVRDKLQESVNLHLIADVPVGVMLSGGLDSSSLAALAAPNVQAPLKTFSIGFDVDSHDETPFARMVAQRYGTDHRELVVARRMAAAVERDLVSVFDEPFGDSSSVPTLYLSELARRDVKVALSGEGGDEVFGGYNWYSRGSRAWRPRAVPARLRQLAFGAVSRLLPRGFKGQWSASMAALDPLEWHVKMLGGFLRREKHHILAPQFLKQFAGYDDYWHFRRFWRPELDEFTRMQYLDLKTYLVDDPLTKTDRASMAVSLEVRVPLLDHELVELVFSLPKELRNRHDEQKYLFKAAMQDALPPAILSRRKKGFSMPLNVWHRAVEPVRAAAGVDSRVFNEGALPVDGASSGDDRWTVMVLNRWLSDAGSSSGVRAPSTRRLATWTPPALESL